MRPFPSQGAGDNCLVSGRSATGLLRRPVLLRGIRLGRSVDAVLDAAGSRVLGLDVLCGDGAHRFLPLSAVEARETALVVRSALILLDEAQLRFYRARGRSLRELLDTPQGDGARLADLLLGPDGVVVESVVRDGGNGRRLPPHSPRAAA